MSKKRCLYLFATSISLCLLIYAFLYSGLSHKSSSESLESFPQLITRALNGVDIPTRTTKPRGRPPALPQLHVKLLPRPRVTLNMTDAEAEENFFRYLENKDVRCSNDRRLGHHHDGGWNVCLSPPFSFLRPCVVISIGIGPDWQFDEEVAKNYGCRVLAYDPSILEMKGKKSPLIQFRRVGIGPRNTANMSGWQLRTLGTIIRDEGLENQTINYVKMDVEYNEWEVLKSVYQEKSLRNVQQFGLEIHSKELFRGPEVDMTSHVRDFVRMYEALRPLEDEFNFRKFNYRHNPFGDYTSNFTGLLRSCCYELHYLNMNFVNKSDIIYHHKDSKLFH